MACHGAGQSAPSTKLTGSDRSLCPPSQRWAEVSCYAQKGKRMINWKCSKREHDLIAAIARRAMTLKVEGYTQQACIMDLTACHCNGMPLDLQAIMDARELDFSHDVFGIARHINRRTGKLENCFVPRMAKREREVANA
jgi:hypothetical protein